MIAVVGLAFSMGELWGETSEPRLFAQHVRGVSRFLENLLRQAEPPPEITSGVGDARSAQQEEQERQEMEEAVGGRAAMDARSEQPPVAWRRPRGRKYGTEEFLTFELAESPGVFAWPEEPLPFVVCSIRVDPDEGLFLLWKSRLETDFEEEAPREFRVSPYVTGIAYYYYDTSGAQPEWEREEQPRSSGGERELPARIELTFEYKGETLTTTLVLPQEPSNVPVY